MPRTTLQLYRGNGLPGLLGVGEPAFSLDQKEFFIGNGSENVQVGGCHSPNGARLIPGYAEELVTVEAAAYTESVGVLLPLHAVIECVAVRVVTAIPTATRIDVGDSGQANRFNVIPSPGTISTAAGTTHVSTDATVGLMQSAAAKIRITPDVTPAAATGQVRVCVFYRQYIAPIS